MRIEKYPRSRFWAVYDEAGGLICLAVYKRGANEIVRRMEKLQAALHRLTEALTSE